MSRTSHRAAAVLGAITLAGAGAAAVAGASATAAAPASVKLELKPSSAQLAACMPHADVDFKVALTTDAVGYDVVNVNARGLPKNTAFTVFLLQKAATPFGAAEYIGDITSNGAGVAHNQFKLIVQEAFSSTLVGTKRVRADLNSVGMWFADPAADDFCLGPNSPITPFDGDNEAGVQAFNSGAAKLPAP